MTPGSHRDPLRLRLTKAMEPTDEGLPNRRVVLVPIVLLLVVFVGLVVGGITGSSSGILNGAFNSAEDPNHLLGAPQGIRSDEWAVNTSWTLSQVEQGLPIVNHNLAGTDASTLQDLPTSDWSMAFRPHLLGFTFLPVDNGMAFKWWLPFLSLIAAVYLFAVSLLPRRPVFAGLLAIGFAFAPFFQWWFGPNTFWPAAWALLVMTTVVWLLRTRRRWPRILFPLVTAYLAVAVGTTVYIPFILPAVLVAVAFGVGAVATPSTSSVQGLRTRLKSLRGLLIAAIAAAAVLVVWVLTRLDTIRGLSSTVYPGERRQLVGAATLRDVVALFSAPFSADLDRAEGIPLDINASEAATFVLIGLFLAIPLLWTVVAGKRGTGVDWTSVALLALGLLLLAFMFIPGWDPVAHLLFLDRVPLVRLRYAFGLLALVLIVMLALRLDERRASGMARVPCWVVAITAIAAAGTSAVVAWFLLPFQSVLTADATWIVLSILAVLAVTAFTVRLPVWGAAIVLVISLATGATVNPVYAGVYDLNGNSVVKAMKRVDAQAPGTWVGAGNTSLLTIALLQSGLPSLNGFQGAPSRKIWDEIDPAGTDEKAWNRLANVSWTFGQDAPDPRNPADDQILLTFDSCASFAQHRVSYVLSELQSDQPCLELVESVQPGPLRFYIYRVVTGP